MNCNFLTSHSNKIFLVLIVYVVIALFASMQSVLTGSKQYHDGGRKYNKYNNYTIFKQSFDHLIHGQDLYIEYPEEHHDLFRYSPTFAFFFGLFFYLPDVLGLSLWNVINVIILFFAFKYLPQISDKQKVLMLLYIVAELFTSIKNEQSNPMIAGLIVLGFSLLEKRQYIWATLCIVSTVYIKLFGLVAISLFLLYPNKWQLSLYTLGWMILLLLVPLLVTDLSHLHFQYESWGNQILNDHSANHGYSVIGWLNTWFGVDDRKNIIVLSGVFIFCLPLVKTQYYQDYDFRKLLLASILIWVVIFNHKAESPTFIIAISGVAIWYFTQKKTTLNWVLVILAFVLTTLSPTDIFPKVVRDEFFKPYLIKVVPCIIVWVKLIYDMLMLNRKKIDNDLQHT